jgi:segregation and condensation protein A
MNSGADYRVDLSIYNGPLDLLLHLIREREVDIHDIPIRDITQQFLGHLEVVQRIDVERAGDFVLMAATLMLIKSRMLLPRAEAEDDLGDEFDPRTDLVNQLLEYKAFKDRSVALKDAGEERSQRFEGNLRPPKPDAPDAGKLLEDVGAHDLLLAFEKLMSETLAEVDFQVFGEDLPVREVRGHIAATLRAAGGSLSFRDMFIERRDRYYVVSVFCALLEMLRRRVVTLEPGHHATDLRIHLVPDATETSPDGGSRVDGSAVAGSAVAGPSVDGEPAAGRMSSPPTPPNRFNS